MRTILTALQEGRLFELPETNKEKALEFLARILDANPDIQVGTDIIEEIKLREKECNTGIGMGVAVPHIRAKREDGELFCAIGWSSQGIDYGAPDGEHVRLVLMYYIPGAQKNVYLKEISSLVKAMKTSGGIEPIAHADNLNVVRNLLLDWIEALSGGAGPEAVARMIKLEIKQAEVVPSAAAEALLLPGRRPAQLTPFVALVVPGRGTLILAQDSSWSDAAEKENGLPERFNAGGTFNIAGRQAFVLSSTSYPGGRVLYQGAVVMPVAAAPETADLRGARGA